MPDPRTLHQITLPADADTDAFEAFMTKRYLPAVHTKPTRYGVVTGLSLLRREDPFGPAACYLLEMSFSGLEWDRMPRVDDEEVAAELDGFGAQVVLVGRYAALPAPEVTG